MENLNLSSSNSKIRIKINAKPKDKKSYISKINAKLFQPISRLNIKQKSLKQIKKLNSSNERDNKILNTTSKFEIKRDKSPIKTGMSHQIIDCKTPNTISNKKNTLSINNIIRNSYFNFNERKFNFEKIRNKTPIISNNSVDLIHSFHLNNYLIDDGKYFYTNNDQMKIIGSLKKELKSKNEENKKLKKELSFFSKDNLYTKYNELKIENDIFNQEINQIKEILKNKKIQFIDIKEIEIYKEKRESYERDKELIEQQKNMINNLNKINEQLKNDLKKEKSNKNNNQIINSLNQEIENLKKIIETNEENKNSLNEKINQLKEENKEIKNKENLYNELKEENKKLKDENKKIKEENEKIKSNENNDNILLNQQLNNLQKLELENKELNKNIEELKKENDKKEKNQNKFNEEKLEIESNINNNEILEIKIKKVFMTEIQENFIIKGINKLKNITFEKYLIENFKLEGIKKKGEKIENGNNKENSFIISDEEIENIHEDNKNINTQIKNNNLEIENKINKEKKENITILKNEKKEINNENEGNDYFNSDNEKIDEASLKKEKEDNDDKNENNSSLAKNNSFSSEKFDKEEEDKYSENNEEEEEKLKLIHDVVIAFVKETFQNVLKQHKMNLSKS